MGAAAIHPSAEHKAALRRQLLTARRSRPAEPGVEMARTALLHALPELAAATTVAAYSALPGEPELRPVLDALRARGLRVLLPETLPSRDLLFRDDDGAEVALAQADVVLVPAVAADPSGRRLGRGGGSYDRALPRVRNGALTVVVVHAEELLEEVPVEAHDVRVLAVLAGARLMRVRASP